MNAPWVLSLRVASIRSILICVQNVAHAQMFARMRQSVCHNQKVARKQEDGRGYLDGCAYFVVSECAFLNSCPCLSFVTKRWFCRAFLASVCNGTTLATVQQKRRWSLTNAFTITIYYELLHSFDCLFCSFIVWIEFQNFIPVWLGVLCVFLEIVVEAQVTVCFQKTLVVFGIFFRFRLNNLD